MRRDGKSLPQLRDGLFLTDGGLETTLVFKHKLPLPYFAAFCLLNKKGGWATLAGYYRAFALIARSHDLSFILESPTWRASIDWGARLGYSAAAIADLNRLAIILMSELRAQLERPGRPMVISGCIGPRGDGYDAIQRITEVEAEDYHRHQISAFYDSEVDLITAISMTNIPEAIGIARAATAYKLPLVVSFTVETDGRLPTGSSLKEAILSVDERAGNAPAYYMINCAHPTHFELALAGNDPWIQRIRGVRANASRRCHAELNESRTLDDGDPAELGTQYADLLRRHPHINVLGGCCGTDSRHIEQIANACKAVVTDRRF
jgi:homocysteine S-methyltransferase